MGSVAWINDVGRNWLLRSLPRVLDDHIPISIGWTNPSSTAFTVCAGPGVRRMELIVLKREHIYRGNHRPSAPAFVLPSVVLDFVFQKLECTL
jgi:hypothetical protein